MKLAPDPGVVPSGPVNRAWRVFGTGLSFFLFGLVPLLAGLTLFPIVGLSSRDPAAARRRTQALVHWWFDKHARLMQALGLITFEVRGAEKLARPGQLIIANHPTLIDVVILIGHIREVDCIVKRGIFENPFLKWPAKWSGYICHDTPEQLIADCTAALGKGHSLLVFPEGTRTVPGQPIRMMHGAARVAIEAGATVLPVSITCRPLTLTKNNPWWNVPPRTADYVLTVGEPYAVERVSGEGASLAARRLTHRWEQYFSAATGLPAAHPAAPDLQAREGCAPSVT